MLADTRACHMLMCYSSYCTNVHNQRQVQNAQGISHHHRCLSQKQPKYQQVIHKAAVPQACHHDVSLQQCTPLQGTPRKPCCVLSHHCCERQTQARLQPCQTYAYMMQQRRSACNLNSASSTHHHIARHAGCRYNLIFQFSIVLFAAVRVLALNPLIQLRCSSSPAGMATTCCMVCTQ